MMGNTIREGAPSGASDPLRSALLILGRMDDGPLHDLSAGIAALDTFSHCIQNADDAAVDAQAVGDAVYWIASRLGPSIKEARAMLQQAIDAARPEVAREHADLARRPAKPHKPRAQ